MAIILKNSESLYPFFGNKMSFIRGLDPLGLQNNSEATFAMLLPGLNNVTGRLRYYSFYCWLLDLYSKMVKSTDPKKQEAFLRKGEYLLALITVNSGVVFDHIPGSNYSLIILNSSKDSIDLNKGIYKENGQTEGSYWKYSNGAFGQYYSASLISMGIIMTRDDDSRLYFRSNAEDSNFISGEKLAIAFDENLRIEDKEIFIDCLKTGKVSKEQLITLSRSFNAMEIPQKTDESKLLYEMLVQQDFPLIVEEEYKTFHRKETIKAVLYFFNSENKDFKKSTINFTLHQYKNSAKVNQLNNETLFGWYYYQFNDYWQFSCTAIFNGLLNNLHYDFGLQNVRLSDFIHQQSEEITDLIYASFHLSNEVKTIEDFIQHLSGINEINVEMLTDFRELDTTERIVNSILLILRLYIDNKDNLEILKAYGERNKIVRDGEASNYFLTEFIHKIKFSIEDFVFDFIKQHIILRHHFVAFRKIGGGTQTTQKFILEENFIRYVDNFEPNFTSPRLTTLYSFLRDLKLISNDCLTELGNEKIQNL